MKIQGTAFGILLSLESLFGGIFPLVIGFIKDYYDCGGTCDDIGYFYVLIFLSILFFGSFICSIGL